MQSSLLLVDNINVYYDAIHAIKGISLEVKRGEIVAILGANGAGKTTTLKAISGILPISSGKILFNNEPIFKYPAHKIVSLGIAQSPEGRLIFPDLTVKENLDLGAYLRSDKEQIRSDEDYVFNLFPVLKERRKQVAGTLSGGEQQMLAISRAVMARPQLLLLDEPSLGIAPILVKTIFKAIQEINQRGTTILIVEQNAYAALKIATQAYVLTTGTINMQGPASELIQNPEIQKAYLGH
ncbi:MAG: ABC transporter ATP-binding protein [Bacteriovoracaceae bacterium]|nr:ABC transporter ATP-binding protein [Bacteriovoracaceae bacterium]